MEELVNNSDAELSHLISVLKVARVERLNTRQIGQPVKDGAGGDCGLMGVATALVQISDRFTVVLTLQAETKRLNLNLHSIDGRHIPVQVVHVRLDEIQRVLIVAVRVDQSDEISFVHFDFLHYISLLLEIQTVYFPSGIYVAYILFT